MPAAPTLLGPADATGSGTSARRPPRWVALDAFKAVALFGMVAHHLADWTGGRVRERWVGFENFTITDLAAPMFAISLGAGAYLVGRRISQGGDRPAALLRAARHWATVFAVGLGIDLVLDRRIGGGGVLYTLAVLGLAVTVVVGLGVRSRWMWWGIAAATAVVAGPIAATPLVSRSFLELMWKGTFAVPTYFAFAAVGAALVASVGSRGEASLPLWRGAVGAVVVGSVGAALQPDAAPEGLWPPQRYPGDLAFIVWGVVASLAIWGVLRVLIRPATGLARGLATAGRRTLWVFALHFVLKLLLQSTGNLRELTTWRWGVAAWVTTAAICVAATLPWPAAIRRRVSSPT